MENFIAVGISFILGIGVVSAFVAKFVPKFSKYVTIAKEAVDLCDITVKALKDGKITPEEVAQFEKDLKELQDAIKA